MTSLIIVGTGLFVGAIIIRTALRGLQRAGPIGPRINEIFTPYYRGGFEPTMTRREASRILGVSPSSNSQTISEAHRRLMLKNHPDKGGSPFIASKINDAKTMLLEHK